MIFSIIVEVYTLLCWPHYENRLSISKISSANEINDLIQVR
jgi:hypothetical protein